MSIGENIKNLRKENNLRQEDLAKSLGISNKTISSWEINRTEPNMGMVDKMCTIFGCTREELITGKKIIPALWAVAESAERQKRIDKLSADELKQLDDFIDFLLSKHI